MVNRTCPHGLFTTCSGVYPITTYPFYFHFHFHFHLQQSAAKLMRSRPKQVKVKSISIGGLSPNAIPLPPYAPVYWPSKAENDLRVDIVFFFCCCDSPLSYRQDSERLIAWIGHLFVRPTMPRHRRTPPLSAYAPLWDCPCLTVLQLAAAVVDKANFEC